MQCSFSVCAPICFPTHSFSHTPSAHEEIRNINTWHCYTLQHTATHYNTLRHTVFFLCVRTHLFPHSSIFTHTYTHTWGPSKTPNRFPPRGVLRMCAPTPNISIFTHTYTHTRIVPMKQTNRCWPCGACHVRPGGTPAVRLDTCEVTNRYVWMGHFTHIWMGYFTHM